MTDEMCVLQKRFRETRDLIEACADTDRVLETLRDLEYYVLWDAGFINGKMRGMFWSVRNLVAACVEPDRVVRSLRELEIYALWEMGLVTCWKPIVRGDYGQQTSNCN
jgi:hypothetical protein